MTLMKNDQLELFVNSPTAAGYNLISKQRYKCYVVDINLTQRSIQVKLLDLDNNEIHITVNTDDPEPDFILYAVTDVIHHMI